MLGIAPTTLVKIDRICDYIPLVSTGTNLFALFQKHHTMPGLNASAITNNHYYNHLSQKEDWRCKLLLIPVIGNITILLIDKACDSAFFMLKLLKRFPSKLNFASSRLLANHEFLLAAAKNRIEIVRYINREREDFSDVISMLARAARFREGDGVNHHFFHIRNLVRMLPITASENPDIMVPIFEACESQQDLNAAWMNSGVAIRGDENLIRRFVLQDPHILHGITVRLARNSDFILSILLPLIRGAESSTERADQFMAVFRQVYEGLKQNDDFLRSLIRENPAYA